MRGKELDVRSKPEEDRARLVAQLA